MIQRQGGFDLWPPQVVWHPVSVTSIWKVSRIYPPWNWHFRPWKWMVGRWSFPFGPGPFSDSMLLVFGKWHPTRWTPGLVIRGPDTNNEFLWFFCSSKKIEWPGPILENKKTQFRSWGYMCQIWWNICIFEYLHIYIYIFIYLYLYFYAFLLLSMKLNDWYLFIVLK